MALTVGPLVECRGMHPVDVQNLRHKTRLDTSYLPTEAGVELAFIWALDTHLAHPLPVAEIPDRLLAWLDNKSSIIRDVAWSGMLSTDDR